MNDLALSLQKKRVWKMGFFIELSILIVFMASIIPPIMAGKSPSDYYQNIFQKQPVFPMTYFLNHPDYPITGISPIENQIRLINRNRREITIKFSQPMSMTVDDIITNTNINYSNKLGKLEFHPYWNKPDFLSIRFNRNLGKNERISLVLSIRDKNNTKLKPIVLQYR